MEKHQKGSDGRRLFSAEFKQEAVRRVTSGEITAAELSREVGIQPSLLQHWKRRINGGARVAVTANEDVVPISELKARDQRIRELARSAGSVTSERKAAAARANGAKGGRPRTRGFEKAASKRVINVQSDQTGDFKIAAAKEHVVRGRKHDAAVHPSKSVAINTSGKRAGAGVRLRKK